MAENVEKLEDVIVRSAEQVSGQIRAAKEAIGTVIFVGYLSALCRNPLHTATQFALLTALSAVGRTYLSSGAGYIVEWTGWAWFFAICAFAGIPGVLLLAWLQARGHFEALKKPSAA